jgi:hypothetical protein
MPTQNLLWSIWQEIPLLVKLYLLILLAVSFYALFSSVSSLVRLRSIKNSSKIEDISSIQCSLQALKAKSENMRQIVALAFYLFGLMFCWSFPFAIRTENGYRSFFTPALHDFFLYFALAVRVFFIFVVLHSAQWFVSRQIDNCSQRLNA